MDQATPGRSAASDPRLTPAPGRAHGDFCPYGGHRLRIPHGAVPRAAWRGSLDGRTCGPPRGSHGPGNRRGGCGALQLRGGLDSHGRRRCRSHPVRALGWCRSRGCGNQPLSPWRTTQRWSQVRSAGALDARELGGFVRTMCPRPRHPPRTGGIDADSDTRSRASSGRDLWRAATARSRAEAARSSSFRSPGRRVPSDQTARRAPRS